MIILRDYESHDGMSELVSCTVEDFADSREITDVLDAFDAVIRKVKHAKQRFRRDSDSAWEIPGGLLAKNASKQPPTRVHRSRDRGRRGT